jgi:biopolymer transport protein ExbD
MRRHSARSDSELDNEINLTPMLDVVFIMLIFFIVTTSFVKESGIEVNRPNAATAERQERGNIIIAVRANGEIWVDRRAVDIRALRPLVERLHNETPQGAVVIAADTETETGVLVKVMDQVRLAGVEQVSVATEEKAE